MAYTSEQAEEIKGQLIAQVEKLPQENKEQIKEYIKALDEEGLEEFLKKNKIETSQFSQNEKTQSPCIFCSIIKNEVPSYKIAENNKAIAILEINPLSKGHSIILPKEHVTVEKLPKNTMSLAQKIAKKIKKKFKSDDIKIETSTFQGHALINIIPIYKDIPLKKTKADEKELEKIQLKLETKTRSSRKPKEESKTGQLKIIKIPPFRIP